jgi:hypothetical protein
VGGSRSASVSSEPLVATWNVNRWTSGAGRHPMDGVLTAVSCATSSFCLAADGSERLFRWNGGSWTATVPPPGPEGGTGYSDVSCPSPQFCMAVGSATEGGIAVWDGVGWRVLPSPSGSGAARQVECAGPELCVESQGRRWTGDTWRPLGVPHGAGLLACAPPNWCAVSNGATVSMGGAPDWRSTALPAGFSARDLSCASPTSCVATGLGPATDGSTTRVPATAVWDGTAWSSRPDLRPTVSVQTLAIEDWVETLPTALSCVPDWCMHVGSSPAPAKQGPVAEVLRLAAPTG